MHTIVYVITAAATFKAMKMAAPDSQCKPEGLTSSRAFFVGDVNIFGMRLFTQIRYFFVNNRSVFILGLQNGVTLIWVPSCFVYHSYHWQSSKYVTVDFDVNVLFCYIKLYQQKVLYLRLF